MGTILVADDDPDIRDLVTFKLEQTGYDVTAVDNGASALDLARAQPPSLLVLDVLMPGMSGIDVCRELRGNPATAGLPIILLTSRGQDQDVDTGFAVGADDYLVKPFSPREMARRVEALLARARR